MMEEPIGQYAIHIAVHTLKDRCRSLQSRISDLEEENVNLRLKCSRYEEEETSLSEIDRLKGQITELAEQKQQLLNKVKLVAGENQELWSKLSRLTVVNQNLGTQLSQINDSIVQHSTRSQEHVHSPLVRSRTFTQDEPHTKVLQRNLEENGKISSELEEISLKLINSFVHEKHELESLCSEIALINRDNIITDSFGFYYDDDEELLEEFNTVLEELKATKAVVRSQRSTLQMALEKIHQLQEFTKINCDNKKTVEIGTNTEVINKQETAEDRCSPHVEENTDLPEMICPLCSKYYCRTTPFEDFQRHVEKHFTDTTSNNFELL